jgi:hypothetical protein
MKRRSTTCSRSGGRTQSTEDIWLFLHLLFETIWKFRFFYRDINDLLTRNRLVETHFSASSNARRNRPPRRVI